MNAAARASGAWALLALWLRRGSFYLSRYAWAYQAATYGTCRTGGGEDGQGAGWAFAPPACAAGDGSSACSLALAAGMGGCAAAIL
jgi:hypothetical protein